MRTAAIILAALNPDLWYSIKKECINSTTVTTALMSKEVLCLALLTWLMENSISVWLLSLWWERQVSWTPEAIAELNFFFLLLANFPAFFGPGHGKGKIIQLAFFTLPREEATQQAEQWSWTRLAFQSGSISSFSFAQMLSRVGQTWTANSNNYILGDICRLKLRQNLDCRTKISYHGSTLPADWKNIGFISGECLK